MGNERADVLLFMANKASEAQGEKCSLFNVDKGYIFVCTKWHSQVSLH